MKTKIFQFLIYIRYLIKTITVCNIWCLFPIISPLCTKRNNIFLILLTVQMVQTTELPSASWNIEGVLSRFDEGCKVIIQIILKVLTHFSSYRREYSSSLPSLNDFSIGSSIVYSSMVERRLTDWHLARR